VHACEIGRNCEDFAPVAEFVECVVQVRLHFCWGHLGGWAAGGEEKTHVALILLPGLFSESFLNCVIFTDFAEKIFMAWETSFLLVYGRF
jgi:hypothetical protein